MNQTNRTKSFYALIAGCLLTSILFFSCFTQENKDAHKLFIDNNDTNDTQQRGDARIMFYNVENLFDTQDDPDHKDEEFLPDADRHWDEYKYKQKLIKIFKVAAAVGGKKPPELIGLCEIENKSVLMDMIYKTPLSKYNYQIIHKESPDWRGIDVALLYIDKHFRLLKNQFIPVKFPFDPDSKTRDILYAKGVLLQHDTVHLFVNHFPSRYGGRLESEPKRIYVARLLRKHIDSVLSVHPLAKIIIMGDYNDEPTNTSIQYVLEADSQFEAIRPGKLYNLSGYLQANTNTGTYKYQGHWNMLDQIIVTGHCLLDTSGLHVNKKSIGIFRESFLLERDRSYVGYKPYRTYLGYRYNKGYSDHLPVYLDVYE
jgi:predicted extracellular nuclease